MILSCDGTRLTGCLSDIWMIQNTDEHDRGKKKRQDDAFGCRERSCDDNGLKGEQRINALREKQRHIRTWLQMIL